MKRSVGGRKRLRSWAPILKACGWPILTMELDFIAGDFLKQRLISAMDTMKVIPAERI